MSLLSAVRAVLGIKPVKVGDLAATVSPSSTARRSSISTATAETIADIEVIPEYEQVRALINAQPLDGEGLDEHRGYSAANCRWRRRAIGRDSSGVVG